MPDIGRLRRYWTASGCRQMSVKLARYPDGSDLTAIYATTTGWQLSAWLFVAGRWVSLGERSTCSQSDIRGIVRARAVL